MISPTIAVPRSFETFYDVYAGAPIIRQGNQTSTLINQQSNIERTLNSTELKEITNWTESIHNMVAPDRLPSACYKNTFYMHHRDKLYESGTTDSNPYWIYNKISMSSYAAVTKFWLEPLAAGIKSSGGGVMEIMAGGGMLSSCLVKEYQLARQFISVTDSGEGYLGNIEKFWMRVERQDFRTAIDENVMDAKYMILSWPTKDDKALLALRRMRRLNPDCIMIYIGEKRGGKNADTEFFNTARRIKYADLNCYFKAAYDRYIGMYDDQLLFFK